MWRLLRGQVAGRRGRFATLATGIIVAAVSFVLLTSAISTGRLTVQGTVNRNFRGAYDILVRPAGSKTPLETSQGLVRPNFLSGSFGGISLAQYQIIRTLQGVAVAAPVAMVGYLLPFDNLPIDLTTLVNPRGRRQLFRIRPVWVADHGLSRYPDADIYVYVTPFQLTTGINSPLAEVVGSRQYPECYNYSVNAPIATGPFDRAANGYMACWSTTEPALNVNAISLPVGHIGGGVSWPFPLLLAAVDPEAEARLSGVDSAMVAGRYLRKSDTVRLVTPSHQVGGQLTFRRVPVIAASIPQVDYHLSVSVQRLAVADPAGLPARLSAPDVRSYVQGLSGPVVQTISVSPTRPYADLLHQLRGDISNFGSYWSVGPTLYEQASTRTSDGRPDSLAPKTVANNPQTYFDKSNAQTHFAAVPLSGEDLQFRRVREHLFSNQIRQGVADNPALDLVGQFDATRLPGFSPLSQVPLGTYQPPVAAPADARSRALLHGQPLLPNGDLGGYLNSPPLLLTTLAALPTLTNSQLFTNTDAARPISAIRIRVAGVHGLDKLSQQRIRAVAQQILQRTGLDVDVTIGSSPHPLTIALPAGRFGRPPLTLTEGWVDKGVSVRILQAVDRKSLALFVLVLVVCGFFLVNASAAAVRSRRSELAMLACLGWPRRRLFALIETELALLGLVAGAVGVGLAVLAGAAIGLRLNLARDMLVVPVAVLVAGLAGLWPALMASRTAPLLAVHPPVVAPRRPSRVRGVGSLALANLRRTPGRSTLAAGGLLVGVAALTVLVAITLAFRGTVTGTLLGNAVTVQVRGVDYASAALVLALGALSVADVLYLDILERREEIAVIQATGWAPVAVRRLFAVEGLAVAVAGTVTGAAVGLLVARLALGVPLLDSVLAALGAAIAATACASVAVAIPLRRLDRLSPAVSLAGE